VNIEAQPKAFLTDYFAAALLRGEISWPALTPLEIRIFDRQDRRVASGFLTGLAVLDSGAAYADPLFMSNYVPSGDSLLLVEFVSQTYGTILAIEMAEVSETPLEPFWLVWDAQGIFRL
jgi:hypothetical protein